MGLFASALLCLALSADPHAELAAQIEQDFARGEDGFSRHLDREALLRRSLAGLDLLKGFEQGMREGWRQQGMPVGKSVLQALANGGSLRLLRIREAGKERRALFRVLPEEGGVSYLDLVLTPPGQSPARIVDFYVVAAGELLSETFRRAALMGLADAKPGQLARLREKERATLKNLPLIKKFLAAHQAQDWKQALALYQQLPKALRDEKTYLLNRLDVASRLGDDQEYLQAIQQLLRDYPKDPAAELVAIDGYILQKKPAEAIQAVDRLDALVGGDPYLRVMRAGIYLPWGKREEARASLARAIQEEPTMTKPYWALITLALQDQQWDETARLLTAVERDASVKVADLTTIKDYAQFVKTPQYREWLQRKQAR